MKRISILLSVLLSVVFFACKKDENKVFFEGGTAPTLNASASSLPLSFATADDELVRLSWNNPNYVFTTGVSSQDVNYIVEIDVEGANFGSSNKQSVSISNELSVTFTVDQFNSYLRNQLELAADIPQSIEIRLVASLGNLGAGRLVSNTLRYTVVPYETPPAVEPPSSGKLFITGNATPADWMDGGDAELPSQQFTRISETVFEIASIELIGGNSYLFVPVYGNWDNKYGFDGPNNENNVNGDDFRHNGGDMKAPAATANYKITVDFQRGKFIVTPL